MARVFFDMLSDRGICNAEGFMPEAFGFRDATVDEIWEARNQQQMQRDQEAMQVIRNQEDFDNVLQCL